ncbi:MAG: PBSX family phage terminase large subunit [Clostridia bacterium]|nr:PBSX family phage terminase large subunit [Clostridia bacterium]
MAAQNTLAEIMGKRLRPEGELEAIGRRMHENMARCFDEAAQAVESGMYSKALLGGGRGSTKSSAVSLMIVHGLERDERACALVLRKVGNTLRGSVFEQMLWAIETLGVADHWEATVSPMEIVSTRTGQKIVFRGLDEPRKIKSIKLKRRRYFRYVWFEELDEYDGEAEIDNVLDSALRGGPGGIALCSYNPPKSANNWVNKLAQNPPASCYVHHSDYTMVPAEWLGPTFIRRAQELKARNETAYRHTYLGECTGEGGAVFKNVKIKPIGMADRVRFELKPNIGMDFGYVDPNTIVKSYYEAGELRTLYIYEEFYQSEMTTKQIAAACRRIARHGELIRADNAAKQVIADLRAEHKINITGVAKGKNSRQTGYDWLRDLDQIVIDPVTCPNAVREFAAYEYARDKTGQMIERYPDGNDHTIDATAYGNREHIYRSRRTKNRSGKGARR